ncbi:MAG: hydrogenase expression/formation protein HypE [Phycisphaeraceae bacterium]
MNPQQPPSADGHPTSHAQAPRRRAKLSDEFITLSHGGGGQATQTLIDDVFVKAMNNPVLARLEDQAQVTIDGVRLAFTTDSYVVDPIFFPGGDIGCLAVHGTINDLVTCGAEPLYLSLGVILEEGFAVADLRRITASIARAANEAGVQVVTGDTKVVPRGKADRIYLNTAGIGVVRGSWQLSPTRAAPGDRVLISGPIGDHGVAILAARGELDFDVTLESDTAALHGLVHQILQGDRPPHCFKDATRGGVATALNEIAQQANVGVTLIEDRLPVKREVAGACEILGIDPLYLANEGKLLVIAPAEATDNILATMRAHPLGKEACVIGTIGAEPPGMVILRTAIGGTRVVDTPAGEVLPRIC